MLRSLELARKTLFTLCFIAQPINEIVNMGSK